MTAEQKPKRVMPKGGRKGGTVFPRISLKEAINYSRKLVGKTHVSAQPRDVILSGVVGSKGSAGNARISALKQFGLLKGDNKSNYSAEELAKRIDAAPEEELQELYRKSAIKPSVFKAMFDTFQGDKVGKAKLKQRAADLKVHPEETEKCVDIYISSLAMAGLVKIDADGVTHISSGKFASGGASLQAPPDSAQEELDEISDSLDGQTDKNEENGEEEDLKDFNQASNSEARQNGPRAVFNVNVTLDSSLDTEKLQRQLELLKRFGAI